MNATLQKESCCMEIRGCQMLHVSIDGPAQPPYVNVAFQLKEIDIRGRRDCCLCLLGCIVHCEYLILSSPYLKEKCS